MLVEDWRITTFLLCCYGFFKEIRPSEPFLTEYLISNHTGVSEQEVSLMNETKFSNSWNLRSTMMCILCGPIPTLPSSSSSSLSQISPSTNPSSSLKDSPTSWPGSYCCGAMVSPPCRSCRSPTGWRPPQRWRTSHTSTPAYQVSNIIVKPKVQIQVTKIEHWIVIKHYSLDSDHEVIKNCQDCQVQINKMSKNFISTSLNPIFFVHSISLSSPWAWHSWNLGLVLSIFTQQFNPKENGTNKLQVSLEQRCYWEGSCQVSWLKLWFVWRFVTSETWTIYHWPWCRWLHSYHSSFPRSRTPSISIQVSAILSNFCNEKIISPRPRRKWYDSSS